MEWLKELSRAIDYIEKNLNKEISCEEAAKIACCSSYYFRRMFTYVAGIPLSEYIRRRRMTQAGFELQSTDIKIMDVALKYGYNSPTSFNRAFQSVHGISPSAAKLEGSVLNAYPPIKFSVKVTGGDAVPYRMEEKEAMRIVGIRIPLTEDVNENQKLVPHFWNSALQDNRFTEVCKLSNKIPGVVLGITVYENPNNIYYYIAAATDQHVSEGMFEYKIPAATWVIFESEGHFKESIQNIFRRFLTEWLPFSGYTYAELPDIEVYPISEGKPQQGHSEVWIAVKKEKEN
ncbi:AraC family transcriptional regulator [Hathewaya proteolytica DSM 3090]|uniref:AraC family transcriptional regulator n=1 Tax=Hathewaya proteolytica DSM 3090 TaxID=1121331 RepID=A0A1M6RBJ3_9CLOT|nr:AraC family transcriptional regulator [Hathewaya proteolytica]SHK29821.1 AraC family transcriptional regulator [Hathewaya proteolytica DSM 3090]